MSPHVDDQSLCISCGYSLQGLSAEGDCPECGVPLAKSFNGHRLANADPAWFARIRRGQALLSMGVTATAWITVAIALIGFAIALASRVLTNYVALIFSALGITSVVLILALIVCAIGGFEATAPEPRQSLREKPTSARRLARWSLMAVLAILFMGIGFQSIGPPFSQRWLRALVLSCAALAIATTIGSLFQWLAELSERIPDFKLKKQVITRQYELCSVLVLLTLVHSAGAVIKAMRPPQQPSVPQTFTVDQISSCLSGLLSLALVFSIAHTAGTMGRYRKQLRNISDQNGADSVRAIPFVG